MTTFMPIAYDMHNKQVLIIGAGNVALRKANKFLAYQACVTIVAPCIRDEFHAMELSIIKQPFSFKMLNGYDIVVCCTNDTKLNDQIASECIQRNIMVNNCSSHTQLNLKMMEIIHFDDSQIAVISGHHAKRKKIVDIIKKNLLQFKSQ